jgi:hypothetical protein
MIARSEACAGRVHVGVVYGPDSEPFITTGGTRDQLMRRLGRYVRRNAPTLLWPEDAERVATLLDAGDVDGAVAAYFEATRGEGQPVRWEQQQLAVRRVRCPGAGVGHQ